MPSTSSQTTTVTCPSRHYYHTSACYELLPCRNDAAYRCEYLSDDESTQLEIGAERRDEDDVTKVEREPGELGG